MKWIGQHIWDFISRFRSDVYLEGTDSGTIASGGNLGLDSNNKIVKSASPSGTIDLTSEVTGTLPVSSGGTGATTLTDNAVLTGTGTSAITAESELTYNGGMLSLTQNSAASFFLTNTSNAATDSHIEFYNSHGGNDGVDNDDCGTLMFYGNNNASGSPEKISFGEFRVSIQERDDGDEAGIMRLKVATSNDSTSAQQQALTATGHATANTVNVGLGYGATSMTTIAGDLDIDGDAITSAGALSITPGDGAGTLNIGSKLSYLDSIELLQISGNSAASQPAITLSNAHTGAVGPSLNFNKTADGSDDDQLGKIAFAGDDDAGGTNTYAQIEGYIGAASAGNEKGKLVASVASYDGEIQPGLTIASGDAEDEVDVTIGSGLASMTRIVGDLQTGGEDIIFESSVASHPFVEIRNTNSDGTSPTLKFFNKKGGGLTDGVDGDFCGSLQFYGMDDGTPTEQLYGEIFTRAHDVTSGEESGVMYLRVASHTGATTQGLSLTGGSEGNEVDVFIGSGTSSNTTVAGNLNIGGDAISPSGALKIGAADVSGVAFHIDADTDTDNVVQIDAGLLDINVTDDITIDAADNITITTAGTDADGKISLTSRKISKVFDFDTETFENGYSDNEGAGEILRYGSAQAGAIGTLHFLHTDGSWDLCDANTVATGGYQLLGVAMGTDPGTHGMLLDGYVRIASANIDGTPAIGAPVYVADDATGEFDFAAPTGSTDFIRVVGYCIDIDSSNILLRFKPDNTWVKKA